MGAGDETVDLFRAVSRDEFEDIFQTGGFRPHPGGKSLEGKQFGRNLGEVIELGDALPDTAAVVGVRIPGSSLPHFDVTPVDPSILKSGSVTVQPGQYDLFNDLVKRVWHAF